MNKKDFTRLKRKQLDEQLQSDQSALFKKWHVGFAFGSSQVEEYIKEQRALGYEGKFTPCNNVCPGMIARSEGVHEFVDELIALHQDYKKRKRSIWTMDALIEQELADHECYYTGNYLDENMMSSVRFHFPEATDEDFRRVYLATVNEH